MVRSGPDDRKVLLIRIDRPVFNVASFEAILVSVTDRGVVYDPPITHLGKPIDTPSPIRVAGLALVYLRALVEEAAGLEGHNTSD